ncbi:hypothetical protein N9W84_01515 [bacterium]|nr:hypothetical protein [bacterium]
MSLFMRSFNSSIPTVHARMGDLFFHDVFYRVQKVEEGFFDPEDATYYVYFSLSHVEFSDSVKIELPCRVGTLTVYAARYDTIEGNKVEITKNDIEHLKSYVFKRS